MRYAFVVPRFADDIIGGAETLAGGLASKLAARGDEVHVLTTCARDNRTWENFYEPGEAVAHGVPVTRFPVDERNLDSWIPKQIAISDGMSLTVDDQLEWMEESVNAKGLYKYIDENADSFDAIFFAPYLFGTTFWGSQIRPDKSVLIPCLHNENQAYMEIIQSMFRNVRGSLFNANAEQELAQSLYGEARGGEVGMGFDLNLKAENRDTFFDEEFPYILYFGRKETGKNVQVLVDYFTEAKDSGELPGELKLVVAGGGSFEDLHRSGADKREDIVDVPAVSEEDKLKLTEHCLAMCQPSVNESFSIVLMEAWLLSKPVLVHADCTVTREHVVSSGGGLYFSNKKDFSAVIQKLHEDSELVSILGQAGRSYVEKKYCWDAVLERFDSTLDSLLDS